MLSSAEKVNLLHFLALQPEQRTIKETIGVSNLEGGFGMGGRKKKKV